MSSRRKFLLSGHVGLTRFILIALWFATGAGAETTADSGRAEPINLSCKVGEKVITYRVARIEVMKESQPHTEFWSPTKEAIKAVLRKGLGDLAKNQPTGESHRFNDFMDDFVYGVVGSVHYSRGKEMRIIGRMGVSRGEVPGELRSTLYDGRSPSSVLLVFDYEKQSFSKASFSLHPWLIRDIEW